jgi:hypothetical protein
MLLISIIEKKGRYDGKLVQLIDGKRECNYCCGC